ncbi:MAG: GHKL domain-containing protein [Clostridia bacterium]|nr:GHKL domain-containing protein [Clostridia bacterium]
MILRDISLVWSLLHTLLMFVMLFESRYPRKKATVLTLSTMLPLIVVNIVLMCFVPSDSFGVLMLATCTLPSLIFFWFIAKNRDGRFLFTFCFVDTTVLEIIYITQILNYYITPDSYVFMFVSRIVILPIFEIYFYKRLRPGYLEMQRHTKKGWGVLALISAIFYVAISLMMNHPVPIIERPEYIPTAILIFLLMPAIYLHIFSTLRNQQKLHEMTERDDILQLQVSNITARANEFSAANEKFRMERHNYRHKMQTIAGLVEKKQYDELKTLVHEYNAAIKETRVKRYCNHTVLDAVFASYLQRAENMGISLRTSLDFPDELSVPEAELAVVLANAIENAINACEALPPEQRYLKISVLTAPCFMMQIQNSFNGEVEFDDNGIPINHDEEHGFGTRSIAAFCEKHNVFFEFKTEDNVFSLRLVFGNK